MATREPGAPHPEREEPVRRRSSLAARFRLALVAAALAMAAVAAAASRLPAPWWAVLLAALAVGLPVGWWLLDRALAPALRILEAVRDGLRGFADRDFSLHLIADRRDELAELVALYNEVGDRLRADRGTLAQKEVLLDTVLQATPIAIVLANARGRVVLANRAARDLFATDGRLEGRDFGAILADCPQPMQEALAAGQDALFSVGEGEAQESFHLGRRLFDLHGQRHTLYLLQRLTFELRRQEVEVWKRAIRTMSHELGNSLAPIASLARSAREMAGRPELQEKLASSLEVVEERAGHLKGFLEGYARFARLPRPVKREVDWGPFLAELAQLFPFELEGDLPARPGRFDPAQMQQALINLLKNAHESGSPADEVRLRAEATADGGVRLRVTDRGTGMSEEALQRALLPFHSSKPTGAGVGLPLAREIVEAHGGRLRIERREDGGTAVVCWLPGD